MKTTTEATSSGVQMRPSGKLRRTLAPASSTERPLSRAYARTKPSQRSVDTGPGLTAFTKIPCGPYCSASAEVMARSALAEQYGPQGILVNAVNPGPVSKIGRAHV